MVSIVCVRFHRYLLVWMGFQCFLSAFECLPHDFLMYVFRFRNQQQPKKSHRNHPQMLMCYRKLTQSSATHASKNLYSQTIPTSTTKLSCLLAILGFVWKIGSVQSVCRTIFQTKFRGQFHLNGRFSRTNSLWTFPLPPPFVWIFFEENSPNPHFKSPSPPPINPFEKITYTTHTHEA